MHLNAKKSDLNTPLVAAAAATGGASLNNEPPEIDDARSGKRGENKTKKPMGRRRYVVCFMCFLGLMLVYMMRVDLSIAILTMDPQYRWDHLPSDPKGFVLSSFYVGCVWIPCSACCVRACVRACVCVSLSQSLSLSVGLSARQCVRASAVWRILTLLFCKFCLCF